MLGHAWTTLVFVYALGEAFYFADSEAAAGSLWCSALNLILVALFASAAIWNVSRALHTITSPRHRPSTLNNAELNDGLSEEDVA